MSVSERSAMGRGQSIKDTPQKKRGLPSIILFDGRILRLAEVLLLLAAIVVAVIQIRVAILEGRDSRSIDYVTRYFSHDEGLYRIANQANDRQTKILEDRRKQAIQNERKMPRFKDDPDGYAKFASNAVYEYYKDQYLNGNSKDYLENLVRIGRFFDSVSYCVERGSCTDHIIEEGLKNEMFSFMNATCGAYPIFEEKFFVYEFLKSTSRYLQSRLNNESIFCPELLTKLASD